LHLLSRSANLAEAGHAGGRTILEVFVATVLYRLGRLAFRRRGVVVLLWAVVLAGFGVGAATLAGPTSNSFSIPGTESQKAMDLLSQRMPGVNADAAQARVVFVADAGSGTTLTTPAARNAVESAVSGMSKLPKVTAVTDPFTSRAVSADQRTAYATVTYSVPATDLSPSDQARLFSAGRSAESSAVSVQFGGDAAQEQIGQSATEGIGLLVAGLVLAITFGSLVAAGLPLLTALIGVGIGVWASRSPRLSRPQLHHPTLALMLGLAVGIDYALFIVSRYRHELLTGRRPEDAGGRAVGTAGSAVVFAGATVIIALAGSRSSASRS
jgi:RND superfamily putative drug exporter